MQILLAKGILVRLFSAVQWSPLWVILEEPHGLDVLHDFSLAPAINTPLTFSLSVVNR